VETDGQTGRELTIAASRRKKLKKVGARYMKTKKGRKKGALRIREENAVQE